MGTFSKGQRVRFTRGPLGLIESPDAGRFVDVVVQDGDDGVYYGPAESSAGWHLIEVCADDGRTLYCPCAATHFRTVAAGEALRDTARLVLGEVRQMGPVTVAEVADGVGLPGATVRRTLRKLEEAGLVESERYQRRAAVFIAAEPRS